MYVVDKHDNNICILLHNDIRRGLKYHKSYEIKLKLYCIDFLSKFPTSVPCSAFAYGRF